MRHLKTMNQRFQEFISVILSIWVSDSMIKQTGILSGLNNLWGLILVAGVTYVVLDYILEIIIAKVKS